MPASQLARRTALGAVLALACVPAASAAASPPPVPPVAEIPVAPLPAPKKKANAAPPAAPAATITTTTTTTTTVPSLAAVASEPSAGPAGATEVMPALPAPAAGAPLHIVLVDELPFRATHTRARELPEHGRHGKKHGRHGRPYHPAPGIVVDVPDSTGGASAADLQRVARNVGYWPFRHCYEEGLRRDQHIGGKVSLDLTVAAGGAVDRASVAGSTLHDESVVLCVAREASHLALAPAESPSTARMEITLSTGDEPVPVPRPAAHADELREGLRASWPAVERCYASELARRPDVGGRMELRFHVRPGGEVAEVSEVGEGEGRFGDVEVTRCVLGVYRSAKIAGAAHGSHDATFVYAMHLEARPGQNVSPAAK